LRSGAKDERCGGTLVPLVEIKVELGWDLEVVFTNHKVHYIYEGDCCRTIVNKKSAHLVDGENHIP
jgi:hypothetical protein